jgi:protein-disulfide isomerase
VVKQLALRLASWLTAVVVFWLLLWSPLVLGQTPPAPAAGPTTPPAIEPGEQALGDPDAPVTVIEYASLTCPHCASFHREILPGLKERYIDTGKVRLVYRDFPLDQRALDAAVVAHCAPPESYFGFLDVLFETQENWARAEDHLAALKRLGKLGGLTEAQMEACFADQELADRILQTRLEAQDQHDISSTPSFIIDGKTYPGSRDIDEFGELIDPLLDDS